MIDQLAAQGRTVVMCTHLLLEAEGLADQVVMMEDGRTLVAGSPDELVRRVWPRPSVVVDAENRASLDAVASLAGVVSVTPVGGPVRVELDDASRVPDLVARLSLDGARLTRVTPHEPTLEELYFAVRSGELREPVPVG